MMQGILPEFFALYILGGLIAMLGKATYLCKMIFVVMQYFRYMTFLYPGG